MFATCTAVYKPRLRRGSGTVYRVIESRRCGGRRKGQEMRFHRVERASIGVSLVFASACSDVDTVSLPLHGATGELSVGLGVAPAADVTSVRIDVVPIAAGCDGPVLATRTVPLSGAQTLTRAGTEHPAASALFVLGAGHVRVCAAPLAGEAPSGSCAPADAVATVVAGETREVLLVSQCEGAAAGGLQATVGFNTAPSISALTLAPGADITICESTQISVTATDPDGDPLSNVWTADGGRLRSDGASATFSAPAAGAYTVSVEVADAHGGRAAVDVPVTVSDAVCGVPAEVQDIFLTRCSPCHTTGSSGGLKLDTSEASFANLVQRNAAAAACSDRIRVVPGDATASYLIAKLRAAPDICGLPMPRGLPALPEAELQLVESWINELPH